MNLNSITSSLYLPRHQMFLYNNANKDGLQTVLSSTYILMHLRVYSSKWWNPLSITKQDFHNPRAAKVLTKSTGGQKNKYLLMSQTDSTKSGLMTGRRCTLTRYCSNIKTGIRDSNFTVKTGSGGQHFAIAAVDDSVFIHVSKVTFKGVEELGKYL